MNSIPGRVGYVVASVVVFAVVGTIAAFAFGAVKSLLGGGGAVTISSAAVVGVGFFGAVGAVVGALSGKATGSKGSRSKGADIAGWVAGGILACICVYILFTA